MQETLKTGLLSVVLPAYNEESSIPRAAEVICGLLTQADIRHELIFVNDGSRDHTWEAIQKQADRYPQVRGIQFSRNFGNLRHGLGLLLVRQIVEAHGGTMKMESTPQNGYKTILAFQKLLS